MWKDAVNRGLRSLTGHELRKVGAAAPAGAPPRTSGAGPARRPGPERSQRAQRAQPAEQPAAPDAAAAEPPRRAERPIPKDYDESAKRILHAVRPRTMTTWNKLYGLVLATRYVAANDVPGAVVECGVWRGGSMQAAALTLLEQGRRDRELHLFDTFEGMPPPTEEDRRHDGARAADLLRAAADSEPVWARASLEDVRAGMAETGYPGDRIHYHVGLVEDTIPEQAPEQISILRLDTDWYSSTKHELEHLFSRLSPGGVLILDDYGHWDGARKATDEFLAGLDEPLLLLPLSAGRIAVRR